LAHCLREAKSPRPDAPHGKPRILKSTGISAKMEALAVEFRNRASEVIEVSCAPILIWSRANNCATAELQLPGGGMTTKLPRTQHLAHHKCKTMTKRVAHFLSFIL
jgi:hypothetical protein